MSPPAQPRGQVDLDPQGVQPHGVTASAPVLPSSVGRAQGPQLPVTTSRYGPAARGQPHGQDWRQHCPGHALLPCPCVPQPSARRGALPQGWIGTAAFPQARSMPVPSSGPAASSLRAQHQPLSLWMSDTVPTEEPSPQLSQGWGCPVTPQLPSTSYARSPSPRSPRAGAVGTRLSLPQHRGTVIWGRPCPSQGCPSVPPRARWHQDAVAPGCRAADGPGAGGQPTAPRWPERGAARRGGGRRSWRYLPGTKRRHRLLK